MRNQIPTAATGTDAHFGTPKSSMLAATPANSETVFPKFDASSATIR